MVVSHTMKLLVWFMWNYCLTNENISYIIHHINLVLIIYHIQSVLIIYHIQTVLIIYHVQSVQELGFIFGYKCVEFPSLF